MLDQEKTLLDLLVMLNGLERQCKQLHAYEAVPPAVYELIGQLRDKLAQWGIECVVREEETR